MDYDSDDYEGGTAQFNAGVLHVRRIAELQERINLVSLNPLIMNEIYGVYNYQVWLTSIDSLLLEVTAKLKPVDREQAEKIRDKIYSFLQTNPVIEYRTTIRSKTPKSQFNKQSWDKVYKAIIIYEKLIRMLLDKSGVNNPTKEMRRDV